MDTSQILFIVGGAFAGLETIIKERLGAKVIGFGTDSHSLRTDKNLMQLAEPEDLLKFGLIPEFIGRLPILTVLNALTESDLIQILTQPKNALVKQYQRLMAMEDVELEFEDNALAAIARLAIERETGARGLRSILESTMLDIMFEVPNRSDIKRVVITESLVQGQGQAKFYDANQEEIN